MSNYEFTGVQNVRDGSMEKKTYKNPLFHGNDDKEDLKAYSWRVTPLYPDGNGSDIRFSERDWDVEVTFTKKPRTEIRVGDKVRFKDGDDWRTKEVVDVNGSFLTLKQVTSWTGIASSLFERVE